MKYLDINGINRFKDLLISYLDDRYYNKNNYVDMTSDQLIKGLKIFGASSDTYPLVVARRNKLDESLQIGLMDKTLEFKYVNDESMSTMKFVLSNNDIEDSDGTNASERTFELESTLNTITAKLGGMFVAKKGFRYEGGRSSLFLKADGSVDSTKYAKETDIPSLDGYATESWVTNKKYATNTSLNSHVNNASIHITEDERVKWNNTSKELSSLLETDDADTVINKWNEVVNFLSNYTEADTLSDLLSHKVDTTILTNYYNKTESDGRYLQKITKALVEDVLTGNISTHTHYLYLTSHLSLTHLLKIDGTNSTSVGVSKLLNALTTEDSIPSDNDYFISQYVNGGTTTTTYHRRPVSKLYEYIKSKLDSIYQPKGNYLTSHLSLSNYYTKSESSSTFVSKSGDTIFGKLIINGSASNMPLLVRGIVGNDSTGKVGELYLQYNANYPVYFGNTGAYTISADGSLYSGTASNAINSDKLDSYHESSFFRSSITQTILETSILSTLPGNRSGSYTVLHSGWNGLVVVFYTSTSNSGLAFYRPGGTNSIPKILVSVDSKSTWVDMGTILTTSTGNAVSATKLQTTRTIWGLNFNGSANVFGDMIGVGNITASGIINAKNLNISGNSSIGGTLDVTGSTTLKKTTVNGNFSVPSHNMHGNKVIAGKNPNSKGDGGYYMYDPSGNMCRLMRLTNSIPLYGYGNTVNTLKLGEDCAQVYAENLYVRDYIETHNIDVEDARFANVTISSYLEVGNVTPLVNMPDNNYIACTNIGAGSNDVSGGGGYFLRHNTLYLNMLRTHVKDPVYVLGEDAYNSSLGLRVHATNYEFRCGNNSDDTKLSITPNNVHIGVPLNVYNINTTNITASTFNSTKDIILQLTITTIPTAKTVLTTLTGTINGTNIKNYSNTQYSNMFSAFDYTLTTNYNNYKSCRGILIVLQDSSYMYVYRYTGTTLSTKELNFAPLDCDDVNHMSPYPFLHLSATNYTVYIRSSEW